MSVRSQGPSDLDLWRAKYKRTIHNYIEATVFVILLVAIVYLAGISYYAETQ